MIQARVLSGGSTALLETVPGTRTLSLGFWFPFGSRHEGPGRRGFTHFIEHMLFKGSSRRSAGDIAREIDRLGGYLNAFTEREAVCFYCTLPAQSWETAVDVLVDMIFSSTFPEEEFSKEKSVILNEIMTAQDDPEDISFDEYLEAIWPGDDMSAKIAGESDEVKIIELPALVRYYRSLFHPGNLLISASGAFREEDLLRSLESRIEAALAPGHAVPEPREKPSYEKVREYRKAPIQQVQLYAGVPFVPSRSDKEFYSLSAFNCAFGESMSSRLFQNIREKLGYCYSVFSFFSLASDIGLWTVNGASSEAHFRPFVDAVLKEVRTVHEEGLSSTELSDALLHLEGSTIMASEDMEHRMKRLARQYMNNGSLLEIDESLALLRSVSIADVRAVSDSVVDPDRMSLFAYGARKGRAGWLKEA